jgi:hypothetical protein
VPTTGWLLIASLLLLVWIGIGNVRFRLNEAGAANSTTSGPLDNLRDLKNVSGPGAAAAAHK